MARVGMTKKTIELTVTFDEKELRYLSGILQNPIVSDETDQHSNIRASLWKIFNDPIKPDFLSASPHDVDHLYEDDIPF